MRLPFAATIWLLATAALSGCTHLQLSRNTALTATTVSAIQYRMVLDNLAAMSCAPGTLPAHVRLADGTVQISNQLGFGDAGGFSWFRGGDFGIERYGPFGSTRVSEQWGTDAVEDPIQLWELQSLYRRALGLPLLPEPNFIAEAMKQRQQQSQKDASKSGSDQAADSRFDPSTVESIARGNPAPRDKDNDDDNDDDSAPLPPPLAAGRFASAPSDAPDHREPPASAENSLGVVSVDDYEVPTGWFHIGRKCDVPKDACYVGCHRDRYAWVTADGVEGLSQFTLALLTVTKLDPAGSGKSTLMFTP